MKERKNKMTIIVPDKTLAKYASIPIQRIDGFEFGVLSFTDIDALTDIQKEIAEVGIRVHMHKKNDN